MNPNFLKSLGLILVLAITGCKPAEEVVSGNAAESAPEHVTEDVADPAGSPDAKIQAGDEAGQAASKTAASESLSLEELESRLGLKVMTEAWSGDLDGMIKRRVIRVLTVYGLGRYYFEDASERGFAVEIMKAFEERLNKGRKLEERVYIVFIPVNREQLMSGLLDGRGDIVVAGWTITPERQDQVDFSRPISKPIQEILVTGPKAEPLQTLDDLAGKTVRVRQSSSYFTSLQALSDKLVAAGKLPIDIQPISELLEDEDLLEMVSGGLLPWVVVDDYKFGIYSQVYAGLTPRHDLVLREGGQVAYAFRKDSPLFADAINAHLKNYSQGSLQGNILINRYVRDFEWVENALDTEDYGRFENLVHLFREYGEQYGMDALLVAAQGYQESRLDQSVRSDAGAVGIMQLLPSTAADDNVGIPDISTAENNIHAGIKYLDFLRSRYFADPEIDRLNQSLFALAAYNAGPMRVIGFRDKAASQGLDPNRWFGNVEVIAAREIGSETVKYVANIYKYYVSYRMAAEQMNARSEERKLQGMDSES